MKTMTVISGKGGTGKTTIVSAIADLIDNAIMADCDVDAPNLHLLLEGVNLFEVDYWGAKEAEILSERCIGCGLCRSACRFEAISEDLKVIPLHCEGCGACRVVCPAGAVVLSPVITGKLSLDKTVSGLFAHALLECGAEGSGKLVTQVRQMAEGHQQDEEWLIIDGAPGIGCAVIASITGVDMALVVTEPTMSGLSDLKRILQTTIHFGVPAYVCINKHDINTGLAALIEGYCQNNGIPVIGKIPFDPGVYQCLQERIPISGHHGPAAEEIRNMWGKLKIIMERRDPE